MSASSFFMSISTVANMSAGAILHLCGERGVDDVILLSASGIDNRLIDGGAEFDRRRSNCASRFPYTELIIVSVFSG